MRSIVVLAVVGLSLSSAAAVADEQLYKTKNCVICHKTDQNFLGPSFTSVAAKYADDKGADVKLARKIREGSIGVWGPTPMPAQPQVTEAEALTLARWILEIK
ncbi:c-type cytochrome [Variovorax sp. J31P216]|nr:c-type cytochrome [Variovorax sp. J31P216]MDM0029079.1 c-type cytochrome [Variovorax sp. J31P216]